MTRLVLPPELTGPEGRFWAKVEPRGECWIWTGSLNVRSGYPYVKYQGKVRPAYRVSYELLVGPIPPGLDIDHLCRTPACVNPEHLEAVTHRENVARSRHPVGVALRTNRCVNGHEFTPENTRIRRNGSRTCIECSRERTRRYRANARGGAA